MARAQHIAATLVTMKAEGATVYEVSCTGELAVEDGAAQVQVTLVESGAVVWADLLNPLGAGPGAVMVRKPRPDEPGVIVCPRGDVANAYFIGTPAMTAEAEAEADVWLWRLGTGETWRVEARGGAIKLTAQDEAGAARAELTLTPGGAFELTNAAGSYVRGGAAGVVDLGGAAGSVLDVLADTLTALIGATVVQGTPGSVAPVVAPTIPGLLTKIQAIKGVT